MKYELYKATIALFVALVFLVMYWLISLVLQSPGSFAVMIAACALYLAVYGFLYKD